VAWNARSLAARLAETGPASASGKASLLEVRFFGGPYNGLWLDREAVLHFAAVVPAGRFPGCGELVFLPPAEGWEALTQERAAEPTPFPFGYQRRQSPSGQVEYHFISGNG
jgi:hypothetical protein